MQRCWFSPWPRFYGLRRTRSDGRKPQYIFDGREVENPKDGRIRPPPGGWRCAGCHLSLSLSFWPNSGYCLRVHTHVENGFFIIFHFFIKKKKEKAWTRKEKEELENCSLCLQLSNITRASLAPRPMYRNRSILIGWAINWIWELCVCVCVCICATCGSRGEIMKVPRTLLWTLAE